MNEFPDKGSEPYSSEQYPDLYDRICKRCISFSQKGTILLINGLYGRDYPLDSTVEYNWTEHEDDDLRRTLADSIITINHRDNPHSFPAAAPSQGNRERTLSGKSEGIESPGQQ